MSWRLAIAVTVAAVPTARGQVIQLESDPFATPIVIPADPHTRGFTAIRIESEVPAGGQGPAAVTLDETPLAFNEFGDAIRAGAAPAVPVPVVLEEIQVEAKALWGGHDPPAARYPDRRTFEIVFIDGSFSGQLYLAMGAAGQGPHRLLVTAPETRFNGIGGGATVSHVIELHGLPVLEDPLPDDAVTMRLNLAAMFTPPKSRRGPYEVSLRGTLDGAAWLQLDGNQRTFDLQGNGTSSTAMGFMPQRVTLRRVELEDPAGQGRELYELRTEADEPTGRFLVRAPRARGPHRLIIREGNAVRQVLAMHDPERRYQQSMQRELDGVPERQRQAITDLREVIGNQFRFEVAGGAVVELVVSAGGDSGRLEPQLRSLPDLRTLNLDGLDVKAGGLRWIRRMANLETLRVYRSTVADAALADLVGLTALRHVIFRGCTGLTDEGMAHLAGLTGLRSLLIYREDTLFDPDPGEPLITDAGLAHLETLSALTTLHVAGQRLTDDGLAHLEGLSNLEQLVLSGPGLTDAGLGHLERLTRLRRLMIYSRDVSAEAQEALRIKLPGLVIMP